MSLFAVDCEGSDSGEAPIPIKFIKQKSEILKKADSPKRTRKRAQIFVSKEPEIKKTETVHDLKHEVIKDALNPIEEIDNDQKNGEENSFHEDQKFNQIEKSENQDNNLGKDAFIDERAFNISDDEYNDPFQIDEGQSPQKVQNEEEDSQVSKQKIVTEEIVLRNTPQHSDVADDIEEENIDLVDKDKEEKKKAKQKQKMKEIEQINRILYGDDPKDMSSNENFPLIFTITREKKMHINGKSLYFKLYEANNQLLIAKFKSIKDIIPISRGDVIHLGGSSEYVLICAMNQSEFALRKKNRAGDELLTIQYFERATGGSRGSMIAFMEPNENYSTTLRAIDYQVDRDYNDFEIKSVKNAVYCTKKSQDPVLWVRKVSSDTITVQVQFHIDPVYCMAIGISSFLCKIN